MKRILFIVAALCLWAAPSHAQTTVTGTFLPQSGQTPQAAGLRVTQQVAGTNVCGRLDFVAYNASVLRSWSILWNGKTYFPQKVRGYVRCSDGALISPSGVVGISIVPNTDAEPQGTLTWMSGGLSGSTDGSIAPAAWSEAKAVPDESTVDWGTLPVAQIVNVGYQTIESAGVALNARPTVNFIGVTCVDNSASNRTDCTDSGGGIGYPGAGVPNSTGSAWGTSYTVGSAANDLVQLNGSGQLPAVSAALLTNFPTFNQSTTGTASNLSGTPALPNGTTATTQSGGDNTTKIATDAFVLANAGGANTALSNLAAVALNTSLLPATSASADIGSTSLPFGNVFFETSLNFTETTAPSGAAGHDVCYGDSAVHSIECNLNNVGFHVVAMTGLDLSGTGGSGTTVSGLKGNTLPSLATGFLNWTGSAWALSAAGAGISGLTTGVIPQAASGTSIANSSPQLDNGNTTANTLTYAGSGGIAAPSFASNGSNAGAFTCTAGSANGVGGTSTARIECPSSVTAYDIKLPTAAATGIPLFTNTSNVMPITFLTSTAAGDILVGTGSTWQLLAGNNSGTKYLQESPSGVASWATVAGGSSTFDSTSIGQPAATAAWTFPVGDGFTLAGTAPVSVSTSTGTNATSDFAISGIAGGATSNATGVGGIGSAPSISAGTGGAGTGTNAVGGAGGGVAFTTGAGGASNGTGVNSNGGNVTVTMGAPGTGGSGTAGNYGIYTILSGTTGVQQTAFQVCSNSSGACGTAFFQVSTGNGAGTIHGNFSAGGNIVVNAFGASAGENLEFSAAGDHIVNQNTSGNTDIKGIITIASSTNGSYSFHTGYTNAPVCQVTPIEATAGSIPATGAYGVFTSTSAVRVDVTNSGSYTFSYDCKGQGQ